MLVGGGGNDTLTGGDRGDSRPQFNDFNLASYRNLGGGIEVVLGVEQGSEVIGVVTGQGRDVLLRVDGIAGTSFNDTYRVTNLWSGSQYNGEDVLSLVTKKSRLGIEGAFNEFRASPGDDLIEGNGFTRIRYTDNRIDQDKGVRITFSAEQSGIAEGISSEGKAFKDTFSGVQSARGSFGPDAMLGAEGTQWFVPNGGGVGDDTVDGGPGFDFIDYQGGATMVVTVDLGNQEEQSISNEWGSAVIRSVEGVRGTLFDDFLIGSEGDNFFSPQEGNDTIDGGAGFDVVWITDPKEGFSIETDPSTGVTVLTDTRSPSSLPNEWRYGTNVLTNVELILFDDGSFEIGSAIAATQGWTRLLGSIEGDYGYSLATGLDGSIYMTGRTGGSIDGQPFSGPGFLNQDVFLTKYSANGDKLWTRMFGSSEWDAGSALTTGLDGSIYIAGSTGGSLDGQVHRGEGDVFLTKYSPDGDKVWTRLLGTKENDGAQSVATGLDGSIYVAGSTEGSLDGQTNAGGFDAFLTKYSSDGVKVWTRLLGTSESETNISLTTGLDGAIYISGSADAEVMDGQLNKKQESGPGYFTRYESEIFLAKYSPDGVKAWTSLFGAVEADIPSALTTGPDGSVYLTGSTTGPFDGQPHGGRSEFYTEDAFLTKISADGLREWTRLLGTGTYDASKAVTTGIDGAIYISGSTMGPLDGEANAGGRDVFLAKYSSDGVKSWTRILGTPQEEESWSLTAGLDGSIFLGGYTFGSLNGQPIFIKRLASALQSVMRRSDAAYHEGSLR